MGLLVNVLQLALHRVRIAGQFDVSVSAHSITGMFPDGFHCTFPVDEGTVGSAMSIFARNWTTDFESA
jgi:hypothetical protein